MQFIEQLLLVAARARKDESAQNDVELDLVLPGRYLATALVSATLGYAVLAYGGVELTKGDGRFAAVWLPNAIALALLLQFRPQAKAAFLLACFTGSVLGNVAAGTGLLLSVGFSIGNFVEIGFALVILRRLNRRQLDMENMGDLLLFVAVAGCAAPLLSATIAQAVLGIAGDATAQSWFDWWMADAMGMTLVATTLMIFIQAFRKPQSIMRRHWTEWAAINIAGLAMTVVVFSQSQFPLLFLVVPILTLNAFRLGSLGTALALSMVTVVSAILTLEGSGPINLIDRSIEAQLLVLQAFLATGFVISLPVAAAVRGRREAMDILRLREQQLALLADNISDAVMSYDMQGNCTYASPSVADVLGLPSESFLGRRPTDRIHPDARDEVTKAQLRLLSGNSETERFTYRRFVDTADGEPAYIEANCKVVRGEKDLKPEGIIVSCRDVTERERLEANLICARQHAENVAHAKSEFLANMSHEIRTPMNGVLGFSELLLQSDLPPEIRRHIELIDESGKSMMRLLNDILDISKIEAGQTIITKEPVCPGHILLSCIQLHSANAARKGIQLVAVVDESLPSMIVTDGIRLRQIIHNLIGNALKFTAEGSVTLEATVVDDEIIISIKDTGIGILPDRMETIFEPFEQADKTTSRSFGGTGLGLTISRHLADLLGGSLNATSIPGIGSRFVLRMPLILPVSLPGAANLANSETAAALPQSMPAPCRILLAEDHDINRMLVKIMLERCGQQVETVDDGDAAVSAVLAADGCGSPFQLVLMDIQMPKCDGYEATKILRSAGIFAEKLPIVALTANAFEEDVRAAKASGMQAHLAKPLAFDELVKVLQHWLPDSISSYARQPDLDPTDSGSPLQIKWRERRSEAIKAVEILVREGELQGARLDEIGSLVHKLAGTAGMFGENELGAKAGALDRAIKKCAAPDIRIKLARELLAAA